MSAITLPSTQLNLRPWRWLLSILAFALVAAIGATTLVHARSGPAYATQPVTQQTLVQSVSASGTVNPQNNISVGTQVSGTISAIYVDYNSKVKQGQVLARLDPSTFQAQLDQAEAALAQARAQAAQAVATANGASTGVGVADATANAQKAAVTAAQANVTKANAATVLAQLTLNRDAALLAKGYVAQSTVDTDRSNVAQDQADVASAQAAVAQAQAQAQASDETVGENGSTAQAQAAAAQAAQAAVGSAQATVQQDQLNLDHAVITSPVDGTVIARDVSVGQTVAASLQTPTLFSIAQNLGKMEIDINVGEPDIGNVKAGDTVNFSVLAYPNRTFHGTVSQVRINPQTVNNVVTYDVVVLVDNNDGALLPGMTANATINVATASNALVVPIAALQWANASASTAQSPWGTVSGTSASGAVAAGSTETLWLLRGGKPAPVPVTVTLATTTQAAIVPQRAGTLAAGDPIVIGAATQRTHAAAAKAPSMNAAIRGIH